MWDRVSSTHEGKGCSVEVDDWNDSTYAQAEQMKVVRVFRMMRTS